jgi:hypothetical protein
MKCFPNIQDLLIWCSLSHLEDSTSKDFVGYNSNKNNKQIQPYLSYKHLRLTKLPLIPQKLPVELEE